MAVNGIEIKVGQVWRMRNGEITGPLYATRNSIYPFGDAEMAATWAENGVRDLEGGHLAHTDLIELVKDENGFTICRSGDQPVTDGVIVTTKFRDGSEGTSHAGNFDWSDPALIAYKVIEDESHSRGPLDVELNVSADAKANSDAVSAIELLDAAASHMRDRASTYDKPEGERSMAQTVDIFNRFHGTQLTEAQGWHFMQVLKDVRLFTRASYHADSGEDGIAYAALKCEAKAKESA